MTSLISVNDGTIDQTNDADIIRHYSQYLKFPCRVIANTFLNSALSLWLVIIHTYPFESPQMNEYTIVVGKCQSLMIVVQYHRHQNEKEAYDDEWTNNSQSVVTCKNMSNRGRYCEWNAQLSFRCRNLQVGPTTKGHTSDQRLAAPWIGLTE